MWQNLDWRNLLVFTLQHWPTVCVNMDLLGLVFTEFPKYIGYFLSKWVEILRQGFLKIWLTTLSPPLPKLSFWHDINIRYFPNCPTSLWELISSGQFSRGIPSVDLVSNLKTLSIPPCYWVDPVPFPLWIIIVFKLKFAFDFTYTFSLYWNSLALFQKDLRLFTGHFYVSSYENLCPSIPISVCFSVLVFFFLRSVNISWVFLYLVIWDDILKL